MVGITPDDAVDNFAVLAALVGKAAEWATTRITDAQLAELHTLADAIGGRRRRRRRKSAASTGPSTSHRGRRAC